MRLTDLTFQQIGHLRTSIQFQKKEEDKRKTIKTPWKLSIIFISAWWILPAECGVHAYTYKCTSTNLWNVR